MEAQELGKIAFSKKSWLIYNEKKQKPTKPNPN